MEYLNPASGVPPIAVVAFGWASITFLVLVIDAIFNKKVNM